MKLAFRVGVLAALAVATLVVFSVASPASAGGTSVAVTSASIPFGGTGSVTLQIRNAPSVGVGAWTIDVSYDPSVAPISSCDAGAGICNTSFGASTFRVNGASAGGLRGNPIVLATITFRCGQQAASQTVSPSIGVLRDATQGVLNPIDASAQSGTVSCVVPPPTQPPAATPTPPPTATFTPPPVQPGRTTTAPTRAPTTGHGGGNTTGTATPPTDTPVPGATPSATLASSVLGSTKPPTPPVPTEPVTTKSSVIRAASVRPETTTALLAPNQLSTNAKVIGTNIVLAIILMLVLLFVASLFNGVLDENRSHIERYFSRVIGPIERVGSAAQRSWKSFAGGFSWLEWAAGPTVILGATGLIYSFDDPSWGMNAKTLVLFLAVIIAAGIATLIAEGGEAYMHRARHKTHAGVRVFPTAIAIAILFVAMCRLTGFQAPVMFGFIAAATILVPATLDHKQAAFAIFVPATILLALSLGAWAMVIPLRDASNGTGHWWAVLPGETAAMLFAAGIEGLLFTMIPIEFLDGRKILRWNPFAWGFLLGVPMFVFVWAILNPAAQSFDALLERRVITALAFTAAFAALAVLTWLFFYVTQQRQEAVEA